MAGDALDSRVLNLMDKQIPYHLLFVLERPDGKCQLSVTYKEASQSGSSAFQLRQNYRSDWLPAEGLTLNLTALNMDALYGGHRPANCRRCPGPRQRRNPCRRLWNRPRRGRSCKADRPTEKPDAQGKAVGEADGDTERNTEIGG